MVLDKDGKEQREVPLPSVLASEKSRLAACFYLPEKGQLFTLDQDCLIRLWDLVDGNCLRSYPLEVIDAPDYVHEGQKLDGVAFHNGVIKPTNRKV